MRPRPRLPGSSMSHANAALTPRHRLTVARLVVEDGWPISEVAARFPVSWPTVKRWTDREGPAKSTGPPANTFGAASMTIPARCCTLT